jgi:hypothetical protein
MEGSTKIMWAIVRNAVKPARSSVRQDGIEGPELEIILQPPAHGADKVRRGHEE